MDKIRKREWEDYVTQLCVQESAISFLSAGFYNSPKPVAPRLSETTVWASRGCGKSETAT